MDMTDLQIIRSAHKTYWDTQRRNMLAYTRVYSTRMWGNDKRQDTQFITIETPDGYAYVESYVASLFARRPAVAVAAGPDESGDPRLAEGLANRFLYAQVESVEDLVRFSLIYPFCGLKLGYCERPSVLDQIDAQVVRPWDLIVDMDAEKWEQQRYVGHRYYLPLPSAIKKWGKKRWKAATRQDFLDARNLPTGQQDTASANSGEGRREAARTINAQEATRSSALSYVEIYEIYDLVDDQMIIWSPNLESNEGMVMKDSPIPMRKSDGSPLPPIFALYMSHDPHVPLRGASAVARVYDQLYEVNQLRTNAANAVRRNARLYMARKGMLDEQAKAILAANVDQSVVEIEMTEGTPIGNAIIPVPLSNMSTDFERYRNDIRADLERGSVTAPFTRGIATNATATEVAALTQYTSSEIGRMARRRDLIVESIAEAYVRMVQTLLAADSDLEQAVTIEGARLILTADSLNGSFRYAASDQSSTPMSMAMRRQRLIEALPQLRTDENIDQRKLTEHLVREFDFPTELLKEVTVGPVTTPSGAASPAPPTAPEVLPVGGGAVAQDVRASAPPNLEQPV